MGAPSSHTSYVCAGLLPDTSGNHPNSSEKEMHTKSHYKILCLSAPPVLLWTRKEMMSRPKMKDSR